MQITSITSGQSGPPALNFPGGLAAATAALSDPAGGLPQQLKAYQALAGRWREARPADRASLAEALTDSPFGRRVQSTLNTFTRAAWAGPDAVPPAPQAQILKAFDGLSEPDQQIVTAMHVDDKGAPAYASPADYRARLQAEFEAAQPLEPPKVDTVTLSDAAQARLAGAASTEADSPAPTRVSPRTELATAVAAYTKAAG